MQELSLKQVCSAIEQGFKDDDLKRVEALLWPALEQFPEVSQLWFYAGCVFYKTGRSAVGTALFKQSIDLDDSPHVYSNLGACLRRMNLNEEARNALQCALDKDSDHAQSLVNMGATYVNEGTPELGIPYLERARELGSAPGAKMEPGAVWNLGLLYLEAGRFADGFDCYQTGVTREREVRTYTGKDSTVPEPKLLSPSDLRKDKTLIVWGEQGIGDELMFGTVLDDAIADFGEVIFECHPRLEKLHRIAHPTMRIYPTRKDSYIAWPNTDNVVADYKAPIGDLCAMYRRTTDDFLRRVKRGRAKAYVSDAKETGEYRKNLQVLAGNRPIVGLATRGGVMQTARTYRTIRSDDLDRLFSQTDALFVSLDYDDIMDMATYLTEKHGEERFKWWPSITQHWDYDHVAALIEATDLTVTVCQSVAHLSAALAHPTRVLTPKRCAWRYAPAPGIEPERWYWYSGANVKLYRQDDHAGWAGPIDRVIADINKLGGKHAKQGTRAA